MPFSTNPRFCCVIIYGTRPEAIKLAPVAQALQALPEFEVIMVNTGQHDTLMPTVMSLFDVDIRHALNIVQPGERLTGLISRLMQRLTPLLEEIQPDCVLVQGDTATAMIAALTAFLLRIPVAHVEAGLRTYQLNSPFPEEAARRTISALASWNFCPSTDAAQNLRNERVPGTIFVTGNPIVDALTAIMRQTHPRPRHPAKRRIVATIHRRENFPALEGIFSAFRTLAGWDQVEFLFPVHANPVIQQAAQQWLTGTGIQLIEPMDYLPWIGLLQSANLILSDSGGLQEEASILGVPLLIVRETTERPEVVDGHYAYLVGVQKETIETMADQVLSGQLPFTQGSPYGTGDAARQIAAIFQQTIRKA